MHRRSDRAVRFGAGRALADDIAQARFLPTDRTDHCWWAGSFDEVVEAMLTFVESSR